MEHRQWKEGTSCESPGCFLGESSGRATAFQNEPAANLEHHLPVLTCTTTDAVFGLTSRDAGQEKSHNKQFNGAFDSLL